MKKKASPKQAPKRAVRDSQLNVYTSKDEYLELHTAAEQAGLPASTWARLELLRVVRRGTYLP